MVHEHAWAYMHACMDEMNKTVHEMWRRCSDRMRLCSAGLPASAGSRETGLRASAGIFTLVKKTPGSVPGILAQLGRTYSSFCPCQMILLPIFQMRLHHPEFLEFCMRSELRRHGLESRRHYRKSGMESCRITSPSSQA